MKRYIIILTLFLSAVFAGQAANTDLEIIRKRIIDELLQTAVSQSKIERLIQTIDGDGKWPSIDYVDTTRTGFQHINHLRNLLVMGIAYQKEGSEFQNNLQLKQAINAALNFWLAHDFLCENWYFNQIGTPMLLGKIVLVLDESLSEQQKQLAAPIIGRANHQASGARPGADMTRITEIMARQALFERDGEALGKCIRIIEGEAKFSTGRGMQYDYSFQHRKDRVTSTLSYGVDFADSYAYWAEKVGGTKYAFSEEALKLFTDYYLDGICKTMAYGKFPDPAGRNRCITRKGTVGAANANVPESLLKISSYRKEELEDIVSNRKGNDKLKTESYCKFFWDSEYLSVQRLGYFTSVRMFSNRNHNVEEPYNGEGVKNHHLADGSNFISRTGQEYYNIFPVFDWQKIPGTTVIQKPGLPSENEIQKSGLTDFVGAVTDGKYGMAAFDFKSPHDRLSAKKAWFFFDKEYVYLGAGITSEGDLPVVTTLNQCLLNGEVVAMEGNTRSILKNGKHDLQNIKWVLHDHIAYYFPGPTPVKLTNTSEKGSWFEINHQATSSKKQIEKEVFKLWIDHGGQLCNAGYEYVVVPNTNETGMGKYIDVNPVEILANTSEIQAVKHHALNIVQIAFYMGGKINIGNELVIGSDCPAIVMISLEGSEIKKISVSDPTRRMQKVGLSVNRKLLAKAENTVSRWDKEKGQTEISVSLPKGVYAGKSVSVGF